MPGLVFIPTTCICTWLLSPYIVKQGMSWNHLKPVGTILNKLELPGITCNEMGPGTNWPPKKQEIHRKKLYMVYYLPMYIIHPQGNTVGTITLQLQIRVYSSNLLHVIIAHNHLCFKQNILYIFAQFSQYFVLLYLFGKIACIPLSSRIDLAYSHKDLHLRIQQGVSDLALLYSAK